MKVKNIMFSGFAAAILAGMCGSADAATVLASKTYVDNQVKTRQAPLSAENDSITIENVTDASGNVTGAKIRANLPSITNLATKTELEDGLAKKQDVLTAGEGINITTAEDGTTTIDTKVDLSTLATKGEIADMVVESDIENMVTTDVLATDLAKKQDVLTAGEGINITTAEDGTTTIDTKVDLSTLATKGEIANMVETSDIADVVRTGDIADMVVESDIENMVTTDVLATDLAKKQNVLTAGEGINITETTDETTGAVTTTIKTNIDLSGLATKGEIANMATTGYVDGKTADIETLNTDVAQLKTDVAGKQAAFEVGDGLKLVDGVLKTDGIATDAALSGLQTTVDTLAGSAETDGSVKQQVAAALEEAKQYADDSDADTIYDDTALAGRVTALEGAGYQTANQVETAISNATIQMNKVDGLDTALGAKADASELDNYATVASVNALTGTDGAITKNTAAITELQNAGYQTATDVENTIKAGNFLSDTMTENGTYLVQQTDSGVSYYAISIVDGEGKDVVTGQPVVE